MLVSPEWGAGWEGGGMDKAFKEIPRIIIITLNFFYCLLCGIDSVLCALRY